MKRSLVSLLALAAFAHGFARPAAAIEFTDRFDYLRPDVWLISDGWANGAWPINDWRREQVKWSRDSLRFTIAPTKSGTKPYSSGEIQSREFYQYGYFEASFQAVRMSGTLTTFFTYTGQVFGAAQNEIDFEILGNDTRVVQLSFYRDGKLSAEKVTMPFDAAEGVHHYAFEWTPQHIRWYVDGKLMREVLAKTTLLPGEPQKIYANLLASDKAVEWIGPFAFSNKPATATYTCIAFSESMPDIPKCLVAPKRSASIETNAATP